MKTFLARRCPQSIMNSLSHFDELEGVQIGQMGLILIPFMHQSPRETMKQTKERAGG